MKVTDIEGDLFADLKRGDVIAHGCNCMGFMGAGVALPIKNMFPKNFKSYEKACKNRDFGLGSALYNKEKGIGIYNLGTQYQPGPDATIKDIENSVNRMLTFAALRDQWSIKTVRLGSGIGGLQWTDVKPVLEAIDFPGELLVYYKEFK